MWQDYFTQHGYLEQTAGWQLALEGLLGEALTPVAFPEKASWKAMTKDGLPLLQHSELQEHMAEGWIAPVARLDAHIYRYTGGGSCLLCVASSAGGCAHPCFRRSARTP